MLNRNSPGANDLRAALPTIGIGNDRVVHSVNKFSKSSFKHQSVQRISEEIPCEDDESLAGSWPSDLCILLGCNKTAAHPHTKQEVSFKIGWTAAAEELLRGHHTLDHGLTRQRRTMWGKSWSSTKSSLRTQGRLSADEFNDGDFFVGFDLTDRDEIPRSVPNSVRADRFPTVPSGETLTPFSTRPGPFDARRPSRMQGQAVAGTGENVRSKSASLEIPVVTELMGSLAINKWDQSTDYRGDLGYAKSAYTER